MSPPDGVEPIEWPLLTTCEVSTVTDAIQRLDWYTCRWGLEVLHKVIKSGCRIEQRQLESPARLKRCLPIFSVIAWRILYTAQPPRAGCPVYSDFGVRKMASLVLPNTSDGSTPQKRAIAGASDTMDGSAGRISGSSERWRRGCHCLVERVSAFDTPHSDVSYFPFSRVQNEKMWVKIRSTSEGWNERLFKANLCTF